MILPADSMSQNPFHPPTEVEAQLRARIRELEQELEELYVRNNRLRRSFARRITIELLK